MLYKGEYSPSYLLDPETHEWNLLDKELKKLLGESKYVCPSARAREKSGEKQVTSEANKSAAKDVDVTNSQDGKRTEEDNGFVSGMPGILTDQQLKEFDIGNVKIKLGEARGQAKVAAPFCQAKC